MDTRVIKRTIAAGFIILASVLAYYQVIKGGYFFKKAEYNYIKVIPYASIRGKIFDRNLVCLAEDKPRYTIDVFPYEVRRNKTLFKKISAELKIPPKKLWRNYRRNRANFFAPVEIARTTKDEALKAKEKLGEKVEIIIKPKRFYYYPYSFSHLLGYVKKAEYFFNQLKRYGYHPQERTGFLGVEQFYDTYLKGEEGGDLVEVNSRGQIVGFLGKKKPLDGRNIYLTVDSRIQQLAYRELAGFRGSIILMNPLNGEILALANRPAYNLNNFVEGKRVKRFLRNRTMINLAIQELYPPASVFKIVMALAALEEGKITPNTSFKCTGVFKIGNYEFHCWSNHGIQNLYQAFAHSCNIFFYHVGLILGREKIIKWAREFNLGQKTNIDLPYEKKGFIPAKIKHWHKGDTLNLSIGQGYINVTPIQVAVLGSAIANGGYLVKPYVVKRIDNLFINSPQLYKIKISSENIRKIVTAMRGVIALKDGTAHLLKQLRLDIAGKTGTAQNPSGAAHGWFVGFFPYKQPKYLICVFLEHSSSSKKAVEVAYRFLKALKKKEFIKPFSSKEKE